MIRKAEQVCGERVTLRVADAENLPFEPGAFDAVAMNFGILHLAQPERALAEAWRVLKPEGLLGFTVWAKPDEAVGFAIVLKAIEMFGNSDAPLPAGPPFFRFSDPLECEEALRRAKFVQTQAPIKLPLVWQLTSGPELFKAFLEGTARTGGLLRVQSPEALERIGEAVEKSCHKFQISGRLRVPMAALLVIAQKPGDAR
jgi:SAM-dependent methyltransferase